MALSHVILHTVEIHIPFFITTVGVGIYFMVLLILRYFKTVNQTSKQPPPVKLDAAERGVLIKKNELAEEDLFDLEKRSFLTKTWLFVCHRSLFAKIGDYRTFVIAGVPFFIVLSKDSKLRAFHNVCRHRAFTVVRKSCGNSARFSCKYHGWQYDDQGMLVKAPQFDQSPGFQLEGNGLFEVKLLSTQEGLIFVNFDVNTIGLPFNSVRSRLDMGLFSWLEGFKISAEVNWKDLARDFSEQASWSQSSFGWLSSFRQPSNIRLLGPLAIARQLDDRSWLTMSLLPISGKKTEIRADFYVNGGESSVKGPVEKWKRMIEKEIELVESSSGSGFAYECGGRTIDLAAILSQHQRTEKLAKKKLYPTIRIAGQGFEDQEASAICDALDELEKPSTASISVGCPRAGDLARLEW